LETSRFKSTNCAVEKISAAYARGLLCYMT